MKLLVYYNANYKSFTVVYTTNRIRHRSSSTVDKYNRMFIQSITAEEHTISFFDKILDIVRGIERK